jgi:hypothetical protein
MKRQRLYSQYNDCSKEFTCEANTLFDLHAHVFDRPKQIFRCEIILLDQLNPNWRYGIHTIKISNETG